VGVINASIDKDSPKVATMDKLAAGDKKVYCRCWQSGTFPLCDASHMAHNKATGDNVGPLIVSVDKAE
jgi:CDGSH-type Zn-finger protein